MVIRGAGKSPDTPEVSSRRSTSYLVVGLTAVGAMALVPPSIGLALFALVALGGPVATWYGARLWSATRRPWHLLAAGETLCLVGGMVKALSTPPGEAPSPLASPADALYLAGYLCLIVAVQAFIRSRRTRHDLAERIDSLIVSAGMAVPIWLFAMTSFARQDGLPISARLLAVTYSLLTLVMLSGVARMALGLGARNRAYYLLLAGFVCLIVVDVLTTMSTVAPALADLASVVAGVLYVLPAAAALHPSMAAITVAPASKPATVGWHRLAVLLGALLVAPLALAAAEIVGVGVDAPTIVIGATVMSVLVIVRMWMLVRANEARAREEQALRKASETLVACTTRDEMLCGAIDAVVTLAAGVPGVSAHVVSLDPGLDRATLVASTPGAVPLDVDDELLAAMVRRRTTGAGGRTVLPLVSQNEVRGALVVEAAGPLPATLVEALGRLTAQLSLALETAALVEDLHLQRSERRFRALIERSSDMIVILDAAGVVTYVSPGCTRVLGFPPEAVLGRPMQSILHDKEGPALTRVLAGRLPRSGEEAIELLATDVDGEWHVLEVTATDLIHDPDVNGIVLNARDTTERKRLADELRHQALHDTLTGLANRALLGDRVAHALARRSDGPGLVAVLFIDLDDFKTINDSLGHSVGDQLLVLAAERLRGCLRSADTAARLGGDEFAVLLDEPDTEAQVVGVAARLLAALQEPFRIDDHEILVTASVGIAVDPARAATADHLLRNADAAMYLAKQRGKGRWEMFDESMHAAAVERLELRGSLAHAIEDGELRMNYQPIVDLETGRTVAVEALVRWIHPVRGVISPAQFVPLAEETGLIVPMGRWILEQSCREVAAQAAWADLGLTVNVSVRQLQDGQLVDDVLAALATTGLAASRLTVEITESILMTNTEQVRDRLAELRAHGVRIAIDDFGSGYSSLGYLQRFGIDVLKLDRSFVEDLQLDRPVGGVVRAIVELADGLGVRLVAEGIETFEQAEALRRRGCRYGQGFLYSRPVAVDGLDDAIRATTGVGIETRTLALS
jgi:diguanylate cyclase (GGDEF)-like protein/PAS domain S-box-containing protein